MSHVMRNIIKSLDLLIAKKTFIRKKLGQTMVSHTKIFQICLENES